MHFHFIFNILNILRYMVKADTDIAYDKIYDLSLFMRGNMEAIINKDYIALSEELKYANAYWNLEIIINTNLVVQNKILDQSGQILACDLIELLRKLIRNVVNSTSLLCYIILENHNLNQIKITIKNELLEEEYYIPLI